MKLRPLDSARGSEGKGKVFTLIDTAMRAVFEGNFFRNMMLLVACDERVKQFLKVRLAVLSVPEALEGERVCFDEKELQAMVGITAAIVGLVDYRIDTSGQQGRDFAEKMKGWLRKKEQEQEQRQKVSSHPEYLILQALGQISKVTSEKQLEFIRKEAINTIDSQLRDNDDTKDKRGYQQLDGDDYNDSMGITFGMAVLWGIMDEKNKWNYSVDIVNVPQVREILLKISRMARLLDDIYEAVDVASGECKIEDISRRNILSQENEDKDGGQIGASHISAAYQKAVKLQEEIEAGISGIDAGLSDVGLSDDQKGFVSSSLRALVGVYPGLLGDRIVKKFATIRSKS